MIPIQVRVTKRVLEKLDTFVSEGMYPTRSEVIRDAIRNHLSKADIE